MTQHQHLCLTISTLFEHKITQRSIIFKGTRQSEEIYRYIPQVVSDGIFRDGKGYVLNNIYIHSDFNEWFVSQTEKWKIYKLEKKVTQETI